MADIDVWRYDESELMSDQIVRVDESTWGREPYVTKFEQQEYDLYSNWVWIDGPRVIDLTQEPDSPIFIDLTCEDDPMDLDDCVVVIADAGPPLLQFNLSDDEAPPPPIPSSAPAHPIDSFFAMIMCGFEGVILSTTSVFE